ncbi:hypothetical protein ACVW19_005110 [Streptomyces sp. TE5632]
MAGRPFRCGAPLPAPVLVRVPGRFGVGPGQGEPQGDTGGEAEHHPRDRQVRPAREVERYGGGGHGAAGDGADGPDGVEGVDDGAPVAALHPQAVGVLRDIGDRVHRSGQEQRSREQHHRVRHARDEDPRPGQQGARHRHPRRPQATDEDPRRHTGDDGPRRERRDGQPVSGVADAEIRLDLRIAGQEVREQGPVGEEEDGNGCASLPLGQGGPTQYVSGHAPDLIQGAYERTLLSGGTVRKHGPSGAEPMHGTRWVGRRLTRPYPL